MEKLAAEAGLPLLAVAPSTVLSKWAGASERMLKKVRPLASPRHVVALQCTSTGSGSDPRTRWFILRAGV